jgi:polygalacturonase
MMLPSAFLCILALATQITAQSPGTYNRHCIINSQYTASNGTADDSPAIASAFAQCSTNATITFSEGVDYNVFTPISASNLSHVTIEVYGNLHLPQNITYIQALFNSTTYASGSSNLYWFAFSGPGIKYVGTSNVTTAWIYSYGQAWWDANTYPGTGLSGRPHLLLFNTTQGSISHFKSRKPIAWNVQLLGSDISVSDSVIDAYSTSGSFPFNTDGFDVTGTEITITNSVIYNGDDAIAVQSGSHNVLFKDNVIGYQTHGMSIGSLGQNQASFANVSNVTLDSVEVINGVYASRFKSWEGGQGLAKNISWRNIKV